MRRPAAARLFLPVAEPRLGCRRTIANRDSPDDVYCTSFCTVAPMETLPLSDVRSTLSSIVERVEGTHERVLVTRNGRPAVVLISPEDLEGLEETLDVLSDPVAMAQLREGEAAVAAGEVIDEVGLRELVAKRAR